jgi:hypothetical protein
MLEKLIVFVEEYSMEAALELLLPKLLNDVCFQIIRFQSKDDMLKQLPSRLKGYKKWIPENWAILVLLDRDDDDCRDLKTKLENHCTAAGLLTKSKAKAGQKFKVTNRIVIEELEAWFFGDWHAVRTAYPKVSTSIANKSAYRDPDAIKGGTWEALERTLKSAGYFTTGLRKIECARDIALHMDIDRNRSHSFRMFHQAISNILGGSIA